MADLSTSAPRVFVHVGLTKTGTTWLQTLLQQHRAELAAARVSYPRGRPGLMFRGAVDVRGSREKFGLEAEQVDGSWAELCAAARGHRGTTVMGHEVLAGATPRQIEEALAPLAGLETHIVVTARDLGRQAVAHWQEEVKLGDFRSFATFEREELRADTGRDAGPDAGGRRPRFWHGQDAADALRRWSEQVPAERMHLVVCPVPGAPPTLLWERFAEACGLDARLIDASAHPAANPSLGGPEIALLREVNALLSERLGARLPAADRLRLVKRDLAEGVLAGRDSPRPLAPAALGDLLGAATTSWVEEIEAAGYRVHGDLRDLRPVLGTDQDPAPDVPWPGDLDPVGLVEELVTTWADEGAGRSGRSRWRRRRRAGARPR